MKQYLVKKDDIRISGTIKLDGSKSLSNRALIIQALCDQNFKINNCSSSDDSETLKMLLASNNEVLDSHHAGTTFRFLCSYLCLQKGNQILTGSERMKQRPIGPLVDALRKIGADISYLENEGYPPLKIGTIDKDKYNNKLEISAGISSQFISSLLLIAPVLSKGLEITLIGELVSRPYLEMTLKMMEYFGIQWDWDGQVIKILPQKYVSKDIEIEADWSAASYYYTLAAISGNAEINLIGLSENSLQGDSKIAQIMEGFGIITSYQGNIISLKTEGNSLQLLDHDFIKEPDIAQSVAVACAGVGKVGIFTGLKTLRIKETDRILALQNELMKINVFFNKMPPKFTKKTNVEYYVVEGKADSKGTIPEFDTYKDHRMAMAFAPLGLLFPIIINEPDVVSKSYPKYWSDLNKLGFTITEINPHLGS